MHPVKFESVHPPSPPSLQKLRIRRTCTWLCASSCSSHLRIPSAMQAARNRTSPTGHGGFSGFNSEFQSDPGFSWNSTYTPRSRIVNTKARSSISFRERVAALFGSWANCFTPRSEIKEAHENPPIERQDVSASPSKLTFLSSFICHVEAEMLPV